MQHNRFDGGDWIETRNEKFIAAQGESLKRR
jgi:hypothetical protein